MGNITLSGVVEAIITPVFRILTYPIYPGTCPAGYRPQDPTASSPGLCIAKFPQNSGKLKRDEKTKDTPDEVWLKSTKAPTDVFIATGKSCPPGTFGSNGLCFPNCPDDYTLYREIVDGKTFLSCRSKCENGWHPLDWTHDNDNIYYGVGNKAPKEEMYQLAATPDSKDICWHALPIKTGSALDNETADKRLQIPYNLFYQETLDNDIPKSVPLKRDETKYGPQPIRGVNPNYTKAGVYAARMAFAIGSADPPQPCFPPNLTTNSGKCVKPCGGDYTLEGEDCVETLALCPANISEEATEGPKSYCRPITKLRPDGPSIILVITILAATAVLGGLLIKLVTSKLFTAKSSDDD